jgi:hypothetical protein
MRVAAVPVRHGEILYGRNRIANGVPSDVAHRLYEGVLYSQNVIRFYGRLVLLVLVLSDKCTLLFSIIQYIYFIEHGPTCFEPYMRFLFRDICFKLHQPFFKGTC